MFKGSTLHSFNYLIKQLPKATAFIDAEMKLAHASDKWVTDFEFDHHKVLGTEIKSLFTSKNKKWQKIFSKSKKHITIETLTETFTYQDGSEKLFELQTTPWYDEKENIIGLIIQSEEVAQKLETKIDGLQNISDQMSDIAQIGFWGYQIHDDKLFWCDKLKAILQLPLEYKPNLMAMTDFFSQGYSRNTLSMSLNKAVVSEIPFSEKLQIVTAKNREKWVLISGKPVHHNGDFTGLIGTVQDISDLYFAESKQRENEHLLRTLIDNLPLNVYIKDLESRKILVNKSEIEFCGAKSAEELIGKDDFDVFDFKTASDSRKDDLSVMRDLKPIIRQEILHRYNDGTTGTLLTSKIPLIDADGHAYGLVGFSIDISDRIEKELKLQNLIDVSSSQNDKLIDFAHIVSHNLRSHTTNFSMLLNFLSDEEDESERKKILKMLVDSSDNLLIAIGHLNEAIEIKENKNTDRQLIGLKEEISKIEQSLLAYLITTKTKLINEVPDKIKINVIPAYINTILTNVITNAIQYRSNKRESSVKLSATKKGKQTILSITDNGIGIDLDKHGSKLFGMYKTFHSGNESKGIGLYITKSQIEAMNGTVSVSSELDKGTTFKIYFND